MSKERKKPLNEIIRANLAALPPGVGGAVGKQAMRKPCQCGTSLLIPQMPMIHCPSCHITYACHKGKPSVRCPKCSYNLASWRKRIGVEIAEAGFGSASELSEQIELPALAG